MKTRLEFEDLERARLHPCAQFSAVSVGRRYMEPRHPVRSEYERDRARVIHSRAFRRLEGKTQVFLSGTGDHLRTRLTHTMEVASISRTIARGLGLNEDLTEAIALAHDLGHSPFGHSGEKTLDELMRGQGGFDHNVQSLRVVEVIEQKYPRFQGLNLTWEVREGLRKHVRSQERPAFQETPAETFESASLEAQVANLADEITYYSHDMDDGLDFALITPDQLAKQEVWMESFEKVNRDFTNLDGRERDSYVIRCIIDRQVQDVIASSNAAIEAKGVGSADDVRRQPRALICYSEGLQRANRDLRRFLYQNLYFHPKVAGRNQRACELLRRVFEAYLEKPELLGVASARRVEEEGLYRTVCDYVSGMTDRYLVDEHERLCAGAR